MSRKEWTLIALVLVLGAVWAVYFSGWFAPHVIRVEHSVRAVRDAYAGGRRIAAGATQSLGNVTFALQKQFKLTSLKLVIAADSRTNSSPHALWHLLAGSGSQPVEGFAYGLPVRGMTSFFPGREPEPVEPGVEYRLLIEAGSWKGEHDFSMPATSRRSN